MKKIYLVIGIASVLGIAWFFNLTQYVSFENIKYSMVIAQNFYHEHPLLFVVYYFFFYIFISSLPMPGAITGALLSGIIMGFVPGLILVSFANTIGACIAMLTARYLFRDIIERKFQSVYEKVQRGFQEDGFLYVIMLRLLPIPFFIVNIMLGLTPVSISMFYIGSQIGLLPTMLLIVKAGAELGLIESPREIFSPTIIALFITMAILPLIIKKSIIFLAKKKEEELQL